jgi:8-oxo-dGTP pyrophosphatase MutT (NUDIX family)
MQLLNFLISSLKSQPVHWINASDEARSQSKDTTPTKQALDRAELLWGVTDLSMKFREFLNVRGVSIYDRKIEHHFTGSAIVIDLATRRILMTFHPWYKIWQQLGGHDEGENDPVAISAREAWEESGIDDLWICDWPVRIDPHPAEKCKSVSGKHHNWHYDICYMSVAFSPNFKMSEESVDMRWFSLNEIRRLVREGKAQQRALEMAENSLLLFDALAACGKLPPKVKAGSR